MSNKSFSNELSPQFIARPTDDSFIPALASVLTHLIKLTPSNHDDKTKITRFHGVFSPRISVNEYLNRIAKYFRCSNECFVLSLVYIDRIVKLHEGFVVNCLNIHRLLITSVTLATKFFDDVYLPNSYYARVGGVDTLEMNLLEAHFLSLINYQLFVSPEEYDQYRHNVEEAFKPVSSIHPPLGLHINSEYNDMSKTSQQNSTRGLIQNRKPPSSRQTQPPKVTTYRRNGSNRIMTESYTGHPQHPAIIMANQINQEPHNQVYRLKKEDESMAPAFFNNVNCVRVNRDTSYSYYNGTFPSYDAHRAHIHSNDDTTIISELPEDRFRDIRTSHNGIGYR